MGIFLIKFMLGNKESIIIKKEMAFFSQKQNYLNLKVYDQRTYIYAIN